MECFKDCQSTRLSISLLSAAFLQRRVVVHPDADEEVVEELHDLEEHDDGDAQVEAEGAAEAGEEGVVL